MGFVRTLQTKKKDVFDQYILTSITTQLVVQFVKTRKKTNYQSTIETLLNVGIGLYIYHTTKSKKRAKFLTDLNVTISYDKIIDIRKDIAANAIKKSKENDDVFVPLSLVNNESTFFAIDDIDLKIDAVDDKNQFTELGFMCTNNNCRIK